MAIELFQEARVEQMQFQVEFYDTEDGRTPTQEFLDSLDDKMAAKMYGMMDILAEYGNELRKPYSEHLDDGIFEVRAKFGSNITRVLYFFYVGKTIVMTNGFVKKTQKTPKAQLELAKKYRKIFLERSAGQ